MLGGGRGGESTCSYFGEVYRQNLTQFQTRKSVSLYPISDTRRCFICKMFTPFQSNRDAKYIPIIRPNLPENYTPKGGTYPYVHLRRKPRPRMILHGQKNQKSYRTVCSTGEHPNNDLMIECRDWLKGNEKRATLR